MRSITILIICFIALVCACFPVSQAAGQCSAGSCSAGKARAGAPLVRRFRERERVRPLARLFGRR